MTIEINKYKLRTDLFYDPENHYWIAINKGVAKIGLSPLVQETSGSFVAIQFNKEKDVFARKESIGSLEAEKHVSHMKAPLSGKVIAKNEAVIENPRLLNTDSYGEGWLVEIELSDEENEMKYLLQDEEEIKIWFENEIKKHEEKGWIAQ
ncbi:MAG: glycine cleavage system protein H [Cytophagales bacterium]|nr:glycine cleavage system protein H [Cytophagales bacterium]